MTSSPSTWPRPDRERRSVRVLLVDDADRVLLIETRDPTDPALGTWWEVPGGGVESEESDADAAAREIAEETGIVLDPVTLVDPRWTRTVTYARRGIRTLQHEVILLARVTHTVRIDDAGRTEEEAEEFGEARWWRVADVIAAGAGTRFFPASLAGHVADAVAGAAIGAEVEFWN